VAVLDRLQRVDAGCERRAEAHRGELHRNRAVQLERTEWIGKAAAAQVLNGAADGREETVERAARGEHGDRAVRVGERVVRRYGVFALRWVRADQRTDGVSRGAGRFRR